MDDGDNIYVSELADNAVGVIPDGGEYRKLVRDEQLERPDASSFGPNDKLDTVATHSIGKRSSEIELPL